MLYISRPQSEAFLSKVAEAVQQPGTHPIVFQVSGIGGVGKSTLLAKLKETQKQTQVVQVSFGETEEVDDPIQLMRKLHGELERQYPTPKALAIAPHIAEIWRFRGRALGILKRYEDAIVSCDRAIALEADHSEAHRCRGGSLLRLHRYEEAIANLDKAIAINPDAYEAWGDRGFALWKLQRFEAAITSFDRAITINPNHHEAWLQKVAVLFQLGRQVEAVLSWKDALDINPNNPDIPPIPENLLELLGNLEKLEVWRKRFAETNDEEELLKELEETGEIESLMSLLGETNEQAD